jgi:hypothetical protein
MATEAELKKIAVKMIEDDSFRVTFEADAEKAASSLGITLTAEQAERIKKGTAEAVGVREAKSIFSSIFSSP